MLELASGHEVVSYFDRVMRPGVPARGPGPVLPDVRVPGRREVRSRVSRETREIAAAKQVDATYMKVKVPQVEPPRFEGAAAVECVEPNALARLDRAYEHVRRVDERRR